MRIFASALALIAVLAVLAGCGSSSEETTGSSTGANPPATTSTSPGGAPPGAAVSICKVAAGTEGEARVTGLPCGAARALISGWFKNGGCIGASGASRTSCRLGPFVCLGAATERGIAVTCSSPGRSVAFTAKRPG